ncbi:multidrug resistance-associated protein 5 [Tanacetum coccineum]
MIPGTDLLQFDVHNDGYFTHLPLNYVDGVILEIVVPRMPYEQLAEFLDDKLVMYFKGLYTSTKVQDLKGFSRMRLKLRSVWGVEARTSTIKGVEARNSTTEGVEAMTRTKDKRKEKVSKDASDVVETKRCIVEVDNETEYESDDESDKLVDYLSPGEDELIKLRNRMKANRKEKAKVKDKPDSGINEPNEENNMPAENLRGETFEEHDIYMNELLKSLKTADKDGITEDPFISVEKHVERYPMYDETTHWRLRKPKVGEKYTSVAQFKECLTYYALANGFSLWHEKSGEEKVVAKCGQRPPRVSAPEKGKQRKQTKFPCASSDALPKCPWRCYARWMIDEKTFQFISLVDEHTCVRNFNFGALVNYKWIAKIFGDKIRANPNIRLCDIANLVMKKYKCKVSLNQCVNAKKYASIEYEKSVGEHYSMLRSYGITILDSNPGSTVKLGVTVNPGGKTYFDRFYVCFAGPADGWKAGCRKIIALDGCFLKRPNQGEILTTIDRDGNNHIYPVAWAVVNVENKDNWTWFFELLEEDLGCSRGNGLTLMSDQHKGLIEVVKDVMPNVEHMQCFWHVILAGGKLFEVRSGSERFTVDEGKRTCSCRMWQLSGLPCVHATKVILLINRLPESYVPAWFETDMYFVAYHNYVKPVPGMNFWPDQSMHSTVLPPMPRKMPSKPKRKRIKAIGEGSQGSCRPRKKQPVDDFEDVDVVQIGPVRDKGASGTKGGSIGSKGRGGRGAGGCGGASGSIGRRAGGSGGASGSRGRGAGGCRDEPEQSQDEPEKTQAEPQQTQHEPEQTQVEDQVEQTEDQAEIDLKWSKPKNKLRSKCSHKNNHNKLH